MENSGVHIGKLANEAWQRSGLSGSAFAAEIGQARQNLRHVLARESMDSELLFRLCVVLKEDLFAEYSQALPWRISQTSQPVAMSSSGDIEMKLKIKEMELEAARKEIEYLKEIVSLLKQRG